MAAPIATNDQTTLTAEESALLNDMQADSGAGPAEAPIEVPVNASGDVPADVAPDAASEGEAESGQSTAKGRMVPLEALHESRETAKELKARLKASEEAQRILEQRTNLILERMMPPADGGPREIPDINVDPAGHLAAVLAKTGKTVEQLLAESEQRKQRETSSAQLSGLINQAAAMEREFMTANPDYGEAGAYLQRDRDAELAEMGYTDPNQRHLIIQNEKLAIAQKAMIEGKNPAELVYKMARRRGFGAKSGAADAAAASTRLANIDRGQKASASLSDARGKGPSPMTAARLLEMSESEFAKVLGTPEGISLLGA